MSHSRIGAPAELESELYLIFRHVYSFADTRVPCPLGPVVELATVVRTVASSNPLGPIFCFFCSFFEAESFLKKNQRAPKAPLKQRTAQGNLIPPVREGGY